MVKVVTLYLCDQKKCVNCSYPECKHTTDFNHAKNKGKPMLEFKHVKGAYDNELQRWEVENSQ